MVPQLFAGSLREKMKVSTNEGGIQRIEGDDEWGEVESGKWQVASEVSHSPLPTARIFPAPTLHFRVFGVFRGSLGRWKPRNTSNTRKGRLRPQRPPNACSARCGPFHHRAVLAVEHKRFEKSPSESPVIVRQSTGRVKVDSVETLIGSFR